MTTRPISQIIADLRKNQWRPGSNVRLLMEYAEEAASQIQLANNNAAACMRVANERQEELKLAKEALRWALENGALYRPGMGVTDNPPAHFEPIFRDIFGEKR